jgi:hypothetical protein
MSSNFRSEGTVVLQNGKTYWFKDDFKGQQVPPLHAIALVEGIVGRKLNTFELNLLKSNLVNANVSITIVSMPVSDASERNYIKSIKRAIIGYLVSRWQDAARAQFHGDVIGTDAFYDLDGNLVGEVKITYVTRNPEPSLETPLLDPIDFVAGPIADIVRAGAKAFLGSFRAAMLKVEERLLARGMTSEVAKIRVLTEEELSMVWGGGTAKPLTDNQVDRAIKLLRDGQNVHVESIGQMHQIQAELGQLGVRSESSSTIIPQRRASSAVGKNKEVTKEVEGSFQDGRGTYRVDPPGAPGKVPYNPHNEYTHINITLPNGKTLDVIVTGSKSF